jgi:hypothetical protein
VRAFVQERADGHTEQLRDAIATKLPIVAFTHIEDWRAFVQVCGSDATWATLSAGRPAVRGAMADVRSMNLSAQIPDQNPAAPLLCSPLSGAGSAGTSQEGMGMAKKNGAIIHVERGYQIAEVIEDRPEASRFIGYRLIGAGADALPVFATEEQALYALAQLAAQRRPGAE